MTPYSIIRQCCIENKICTHCWRKWAEEGKKMCARCLTSQSTYRKSRATGSVGKKRAAPQLEQPPPLPTAHELPPEGRLVAKSILASLGRD